MRQKHIDTALYFSYESTLIRFKRAKSEATLDTMYRGAINKAKDNLQGHDLFQAEISIARALDKCQQDFDTSGLGMTRKANHTLRKALDPLKSYDPEAEMRRLLADLD